MPKYESRSIEFRKHLRNAISYMKHDTTNFSLPRTIAYLEGYIAGIEALEDEEYEEWLKDQKENADMTPNHEIHVHGKRISR
tara:strand:+ start:1994 stop:2239 length:246 start_codon:yes stop_codon:yes gene_type:complete